MCCSAHQVRLDIYKQLEGILRKMDACASGKKSCPCITMKCVGCGMPYCSRHIQLELHACPKLSVKEPVVLVKLKPSKIPKI
jgi:hypothetical protein